MKKLTIIALVCVNVALLAGLLHANLPKAWGQSQRGTPDYLLMCSQADRGDAIVHVIDLRTRLMGTWLVDGKTERFVQVRGRDLSKDFKARR